MSKQWVEVDVKVTAADGQTASRQFEFEANSPLPEVPLEIIDHVVKGVGNNRTHLPDTDR